MKTIVAKTLLIVLILGLFLVALPSGAQEKEQVRQTTSLGGKWSSAGDYISFGVAGQYAVSSSLNGNSSYTGSIGFIQAVPSTEIENLAPVAISPSIVFDYELGTLLELQGFDPEQQPIAFEIERAPSFGTLQSEDPIENRKFQFIPNGSLAQDVVFRDTVQFKVLEQNSSLESEIGTIAFEFTVEDKQHEIVSISNVGSTFTLQLRDTLFNDAYTLSFNYYDLSDPIAPQIVSFKNESVSAGSFTIDGLLGTHTFDVSETEFEYLLTEPQVLATALVTTSNGFSSFSSFIVDNTGRGRVAASEDGKFFVIGSELSVPENKTVTLQMVAVDFSEIDISTSTFDWLTNPASGAIGEVSTVEQTDLISTWEVEYTSTEDVGGEDSIQFQVFNPTRNSFESGYVKISIEPVNDLPTFQSIADQQMDEDGTLDVALQFDDVDNELQVFVETSEASNLSSSVTDQVLRIEGLNDYSGTANVTVWVQEQGTAEEYIRLQTFELEVVPANDPPVVQAIANQNADEDNTIFVALNAIDPDADFQVFQYSASLDDPSLATAEIEGSLLQIVPFENQFGQAVVSVTADDGSGTSTALSETVTFVATFNPVNDPPELVQQLETQVLVQDFPGYSIDLSAYFSDPESEAESLDYSVSGGTSVFASFTDVNANITLETGFSGTEDLTFTASDGESEVDMPVTFVVNAASTDLVVSSALADINQEEDFGSVDIDLSSVFEDINDPNTVFDYEVIGNNFLDASVENSTLTVASPENYFGTESLVLIGSAGGSSVFTSFDFVVTAVDDPPVVSGLEDLSIQEDGVLSDLVLELSDIDSETSELSLTVASNDQTIVEDQSISIEQISEFFLVEIVPVANASGSVVLEVSATDGTTQVVETANLTISPIDDAPEVISSVTDALEDAEKSIDFSSLFQDVDGDPLSFSVISKPDWLDQSGSVLTGVPLNGDVGVNQVTIEASDANSDVRQSFVFEVLNTNDAPTVTRVAGTLNTFSTQLFEYSFPTSNFADVDIADVLSFSFENVPSWASVSGELLTGTPTASDVGSHEVTLVATDLSGATASDLLTIVVETQVYNATVTLSTDAACQGSNATVTASGAFDYNWYDESGELLQEGGATYTFMANEGQTVLTEGVDSQGITTAERVEIDVTVNPIPDATITQGQALSVISQSGASYQWFFNGNAISSATANSYEPTESGDYYVEVSFATGCIVISETVNVNVLGLQPFNGLEVFPVPTTRVLSVTVDGDLSQYDFEIISLSGRILKVNWGQVAGRLNIDVSHLQEGIYYLRVKRDSEFKNVKFVKR